MNRAILACAAALVLLAGCTLGGAGGTGMAARPLGEVYAAINDLAARHSAIATAKDLGEAGPGLPLLALEIHAAGEGSPRAQLVGAMHGDEEIGAELALDLAQKLLESYEANDGSAAARLVASTTLTILPVANPWGYQADMRYQASGTDINRNFDWAWTYGEAWTNKGAAAADAPETKVLVADAKAKHYALSVSLHSGDYCISLPWDYIGTSYSNFVADYAPAYPLFLDRGAAYVASVKASGVTGTGSFRWIEGFDWYLVCGSYADWLYMTLGAPCYTIELSPYKSWTSLDASYRAPVIKTHEAALIELLASAGLGAGGRVTSSGGSGQAGAKVTATLVPGARALPPPIDYTCFALTDEKGYFHIALPAGGWSLSASLGSLASQTQVATVGVDGLSGLSLTLP